MDKDIKDLYPYADSTTIYMLNQVYFRKKKFDTWKKYYLYCYITLGLLFFSFFSYSFEKIVKVYSHSSDQLFFAFMSNPLLPLFSILFGTGCFFGILIYRKKQKYEKEYQDLRKEIVDRSKDLWKDSLWTNRHHVFEVMKEKGINLYHATK
ncbi:DUF2663 family protein [Mangrovibacillus cuniculi]|uniref:DUF2663 family protein n=1 Tax=Mangrovibacillus cuniculi TaxID=2593652 RepID=A0A7S8CB64_9BACI|nr:DUF2663 family protein [Mangrovibacillus cuniculi]QPC46728.1 DUF2663 family protein [Mangrovibacillus cuniculi]